LRQAERYAAEGLHPRVITDGFDIARDATLKFLDEFKVEKKNAAQDRDLLTCIAGTSLKTKLDRELADKVRGVLILPLYFRFMNTHPVSFLLRFHQQMCTKCSRR